MRDIIERFLNEIISSGSEKFSGGASLDNPLKKLSTSQTISMILSLAIMQALLLFFGKYLWNTYLVPVVDTIQPIESVWNLLGISILLKLLF